MLLSFSMMSRRSETAAFRVADIVAVPEGLVVTIRKSKVDQEGEGRKVGIPCGTDEATCPVRVLQRYLKAASIVSGFVFRAVDQRSRVSPSGLHSDSVGYIIKRAAARGNLNLMGVKIEDVAGHSIRSRAIAVAALNGQPECLIRRQSGHKPGSKSFDRYIRLGHLTRTRAV
jgi:hypothetical protein